MSFSLLPTVLLLALLAGSAPGDLERWFGEGEAVVVVRSTHEAEPCGADGRPAVLQAVFDEVLHGPATTGPVEVLMVPDGPDLPRAGERSIAVLRRVTLEDATGCVTAPSHTVERAITGVELSAATLPGWRRYVEASRSLPPGGGALERARAELWVDSLVRDRGALGEHAGRSLEAWASANALPAGVLQTLVDVLGDQGHDLEARIVALCVLARVVAPHLRARHVFEGGREAAEEAREALLRALYDPSPRIRERAVDGLAPLVAAGDRTVLAHLEDRKASERNPKVLDGIRDAMPSLPSAGTAKGPDPDAERRLGLRMLLVLLGLLALLGMALLPVLFGHFR